uniref:Uncharacterized protein n=1 Tax=Anguilla anguilla TaxID=7936 RepID=A0A0E9VPC9_ANGAN
MRLCDYDFVRVYCQCQGPTVLIQQFSRLLCSIHSTGPSAKHG